jgi:Leucine-rich repeat (LRR) protein
LPTLNEVNLAAGKEVNLCEMSLVLAASEKEKERRPWTLYGTGKFQLQYEQVGGKITQKNLELLLSKLDTGKLELEVKDAEKVPERVEAKADPPTRKQDQRPAKDAEPEPTEEQLAKAKMEYARHGARYFLHTDEETKRSIPMFAMVRSKTDADLIGLPDLPFHFRLLLTCSKVTDIGMKEVKKLKHLKQLSLASTLVTDAGLKELKDSKNLTKLYLDNTNVTDAGLKHLQGLKNLTELSLDRTKVTDAGVRELQKVLPKCKIRR